MGLFECCAECGDFSAVSRLQSGDFGGERGDDVVVTRVVGRGLLRHRSVLAAVVFDACSQPSVVVEERVGDTGFALDCLECHRLASFDQSGDGGVG